MLDVLADYLRQYGISTGRTYLNSFEGLLSLYQSNVDVTACHLYDGRDYNRSYLLKTGKEEDYRQKRRSLYNGIQEVSGSIPLISTTKKLEIH